MKPIDFKSARTLRIIGTLTAFAGAMTVYALTVDPTVSWWDCPEYLLNAWRLEIGHSPGNPTWSLVSNVVAHAGALIGGVDKAALAVNLSSGLFTALAVALLFRIIFFTLRLTMRGRYAGRPLPAFMASLSASLIFAWSDSPWFSAVETEVYALSLFFTALTVWLMLCWAVTPRGPDAMRLLVLIAYLTGLSIGVHELNLLVIPALALIYVFRMHPRPCRLKAWTALALSVAILGSILMCMYPGMPTIAGEFEILAVNTLGLGFNSGVYIYLALTAICLVAAPVIVSRTAVCKSTPWVTDAVRGIAIFMFMALSGYLLPGRHFMLSLLLSALAAAWLTRLGRRRPVQVATTLWMGAFCILGFSSYMLIPIRSAANPPVNENAPSDVFSFLGYLKRDQYGSRPLFYGHTPYAKPMLKEVIGPDGKATYPDIVRKRKRPLYMRAMADGRVSGRSGLLTGADSAANAEALRHAADGGQRYLLADYQNQVVYTPELNMIFPRLTSRNDFDIRNYESWAGMTKDNMDTLRVSYAIDSKGRPVAKKDPTGRRVAELSWRPTYMQHLRELFGYQIGYMYFRYLLWNYAGRQNDYPSVGEVEHGNIITGIAPLDDLMLGDQDVVPAEIGRDNAGRNPYFCIPLILGIIGIAALCRRGARRRLGLRANAVILTLFVMTGVAIVVYLNQDPGEPRERDYSFMGSFLAYAIWIGAGIAMVFDYGYRLASRCRGRFAAIIAKGLPVLLTAAVPAWMLAVNYDDHDRTGRSGPTDYAVNLLESLQKEAILFVEGDNYTFPVWYAQEVLGVRRDVTIINLAYLTTPWYPVLLMQPGEQSLPVAMTARPADIAYGAYALVRIPAASDDAFTREADAITELRRLYATPTSTPEFAASTLRIAVNGGDSVRINLNRALGGRRHATLRDVAMLDIIATNASSAHPRPVYWQQAIIPKQMAGLEPYSSRALYARKYNPASPGGFLTDESLDFLPRMRYGGADRDIYADPYVGEQISRQRTSLLRLGDALVNQGRHAEALDVAKRALDRFPDSVWPYQGVIAYDGIIWHEGLKLAQMMRTAAMATGDSKAVSRADSLETAQRLRMKSWRRWRASLTPWQRTTLSAETKRLIVSDTTGTGNNRKQP